jgi:DNA-binding NtrC family response regulator
MTTLELREPSRTLPDLLLVILDPDGGREINSTLLRPGASLTLGAARDSDVVVDYPTVSQRHCRLHHEGHRLLVEDQGSRNGTFVGGVRVTAAEIVPGAQLRIADVELSVTTRGRVSPVAEPLPGLVGTSRPMRELAAKVRRLAPLRAPVLVRGESGTGKELVARAVHDLSRRAGAFVAINAATLSRELAESELFGHRRGAFTGAVHDRQGAFREADGGTLFIDELGSLAIDVQAKLLRALEEGFVRPVGADAPVRVDVRVVAATCESIEDDVAGGRFRRDLYERIALCVVRVPPLQSRLEDLPRLTEHLLRTAGYERARCDRSAIAALAARPLRGNVRELRSLVLLAALSAEEEAAPGAAFVIDSRHVLAARRERDGGSGPPAEAEVLATLRECRGNQSAAARKLRVPRTTLRDWLHRARSGSAQGEGGLAALGDGLATALGS